MKKFLTAALILISLTAQGAVSIISDLDDTIKITEASGDPEDLIGDDVYTGMPEFLAAAANSYSNNLYILSASPTILASKIRKTLNKHGIGYSKLILRSNLFEDKLVYKVKEIKKILDESSDDFILIGDDFGKDPEVFAEIERHYPHRILGKYIHKVKGRTFTDNTVYYTSFDLFLREFEAGRMEASAIEKAFEVMNAERDMEMIFPERAHCPTTPIPWAWQIRTIFMQEAATLIQKFNKHCQARRSDILVH